MNATETKLHAYDTAMGFTEPTGKPLDASQEEVDKDSFLRDCVTVERRDGEVVISLKVVAEVRLPEKLLGDPTEADVAQALACMCGERWRYDLRELLPVVAGKLNGTLT